MPASPRSRLTYANVVSTLAVFIALGGGAYAVVELGKNAVKSRNIARDAVKSSKVKDDSLLAKDFKQGQLPAGEQGPPGPPGPATGPAGGDLTGSYPNPTIRPGAVTAAQLAPQEPWHQVGAVGEPAFQNSWVNADVVNFNPAGFFKDAFGIVHLRGLVTGGTTGAIFQLPAGYRPGKLLYFPASQTNGNYAEAAVSFSGVVSRNSFVAPSGSFSLEGITFRPD